MRATCVLGMCALAVIGAHVAVDVEEAHEVAALLDAQTRQLRAELLGLVVAGQARELPAQGLDLGRAVEPEHAAEGLRVVSP